MPTYDYECKGGHRFEKFQSMLDNPIKKCPKCGKSVKRLMGTGAGIIFKGGGFYQTDYRSKSYQEKANKDTASKESASPAPAPEKKETKSKKEGK